MIRRPPRSTRTDTLFPYTTLFRSQTVDWGLDRVDAILCINMVHISPWEATEGLMRGAGRLLPSGSPLYLYGPYIRADTDTAPSNRAFDERSEEHTSELQSLMRLSYAVFCSKKKKQSHVIITTDRKISVLTQD